MNLESAMKQALADRKDVTALACLDDTAGILLGLYVQGDVAHDDVELAVVSGESASPWVHASARVPSRPDLVFVGLARGDADVGHLRDWLHQVAGRVGRAD